MRAALAALVLGLACTPLQAQGIFEKPKPPASKEQGKEKAATKPDKARPAARPDHERRHREQRPVERKTSDRPVKMDRAHPAETKRQAPPSSPPSPAEQLQRQQLEQRQPPQAQPPSQVQRTVQCSARPVCGGAGYGRCAAVAQTYPGASLPSSRQDIVHRCIQANTPDSCNCAPQCTRVARCSNF